MRWLEKSLFALLLTIPGAPAASKEAVAPAPGYDLKAEVQFEGLIGDVREVTSGTLEGIFLTVKTKNENVNLYLDPVPFIKLFHMQLKAGEGVEVTGSKVKFESKDLVLGREVQIGKTTLVLRSADGSPNWLWMVKDYPSGL